MRCDRRSFVNRSLAIAGALMTGAATAEQLQKLTRETQSSFRA